LKAAEPVATWNGIRMRRRCGPNTVWNPNHHQPPRPDLFRIHILVNTSSWR